jgi:hypothetical protein
MTGPKTKTSRRRFFTQGGAVLGAGIAATAGASALNADDPMKRLREMQGREAIRQLQLAFMNLIERQDYQAAAQLFDGQARLDLNGDSATGRRAIQQKLADQSTAFHRAYRQRAADIVTLSDDGTNASATFNVEAQLCTPLAEDCTAASMARLQGNVADLRWETGRFDAQYAKTRGEWKVRTLVYRAS